jgi:LPS-assembly protein
VADLAFDPGQTWQFGGSVQWSPEDEQFEQAFARVLYRGDRAQAVKASYRLRNEGIETQDLEQTDLSFSWPLSERVKVIARWNYSLREHRTLETVAGLEYGQCCWRFRTVVQEYADDERDESNLAFLFQLELYGLGQIGNDIDTFLERRLPGDDR